MIKLKKILNEFRAGNRVLDLIESGTYKIEEGFKHLIPGITKAYEDDIPSKNKIRKELIKMEKQFNKIQKIINKEMNKF
jgi:hypothetical protein